MLANQSLRRTKNTSEAQPRYDRTTLPDAREGARRALPKDALYNCGIYNLVSLDAEGLERAALTYRSGASDNNAPHNNPRRLSGLGYRIGPQRNS